MPCERLILCILCYLYHIYIEQTFDNGFLWNVNKTIDKYIITFIWCISMMINDGTSMDYDTEINLPLCIPKPTVFHPSISIGCLEPHVADWAVEKSADIFFFSSICPDADGVWRPRFIPIISDAGWINYSPGLYRYVPYSLLFIMHCIIWV